MNKSMQTTESGKVSIRLIGFLLLAALSIGLGVILWAAAQPRKRAESLLQDLRSVRVGVTTLEEAQRLAKLHGGYIPRRAPSCTTERCEIDFMFENKLLYRLSLAPFASFGVGLKVERGYVWHVSAGISAASGEQFSGADVIEQPHEYAMQSHGAFYVNRREDWRGRPWKIYVWLTPDARAEDRQKAYSFNLHCLDRIGGCKDARLLLPALWPDGVRGSK